MPSERPTVGLYECFYGLIEVLREDCASLTNIDLIWEATCGPIYAVVKQYNEGVLPKYVALERIRHQVTWVHNTFGQLWEVMPYEQYLDEDWLEWDYIWDYHQWDLYMNIDADISALIDKLDGDPDPDPVTVAALACEVADFVLLCDHHYQDVYVFKSPFQIQGLLNEPERGPPRLARFTVDASKEGDTPCPAIPPNIINEALKLERGNWREEEVDEEMERLEAYRCEVM